MAPRQEIVFPFQGVHRGSARGRQPALTTTEAKNVVGWIPGEEVQQGGQRPGLAPFLGGDNLPVGVDRDPIQHGLTVASDRAPYRFSQLGNLLTGGNEEDLSNEWAETSPDGQETYRLAVDLERNSFWLSSGGVVVKRNADGVQLYQVRVPLVTGQEIARALALDPDGNVYVGASADDPGVDCSIFRLEPREDDDGMDVVWSVSIEGSAIADIQYEFGRLLVGVNREGQFDTAVVVAIDDLEGTDPAVTPGLEAPYPIGALAVGPTGSYVTSPPNDARGPQVLGDGFEDSVVDWTPHDLAPNANQRLHIWLDAQEIGALQDGQRVQTWPDRRFVEGEPITDNTERSFRKYIVEPQDPEGPIAPRYSSSAAQALPGVVFDRTDSAIEDDVNYWMDTGNALWSRQPQISAAFPLRKDKDTTTGKLPTSTGVWPVTESHTFSTTFLVRYADDENPCVVWSASFGNRNLGILPDGEHWVLVGNFDGAAVGVGSDIDPNWLEFSARPGLTGGFGLIRNQTLIAYGNAVTTGTEETRMALITIVKNSAGNCRFRLNGADVGSSLTLDDTNITQGLEVMGSRIYLDNPPDLPQAPNFQDIFPNFDSFRGSFHEVLTVMGTSSAADSPHDTDFGAPGSDTDYEKVEGYMAHRWGIATNVLAVGHVYRAAPPSGGGGFTETIEGELAQTLRSKQGVLARLQPSLEGFQWAINGSGMGYGVVADEDGGVVVAGPRLAASSVENETGPQARVLLKGLDRGLVFDWPEPSTGKFVMRTNPPAGITMTLNDGNQTETFEFQDLEASVTAPNTWIDTSTGDADTIAEKIKQAVTLSTTIDIWCEDDVSAEGYPQTFLLYSRRPPDAVERPIAFSGLNVTKPEFVVEFGMTGPGVAPDGTWELRVEPEQDLENRTIQMATDLEGDVYVPFAVQSKQNHLVKYSRDGSANLAEELWTHRIDGSASTFGVHAVATDPQEADPVAAALFPAEGPEFLWVASSNIDATDTSDFEENTQRKLRAVGIEPVNGPARDVTSLVVAGGGLYRVEKDGASTQVALDMVGSDSIWIQGASMFGEVFYCDRGTYKVYNLGRQTLRDWQAVGSGEIPRGARLMTAYRGRMVLARTQEDAHGISASRQGDPYDWHFGAPSDDPLRAFTGRTLASLQTPDIVTALAPFYDDRLVVGKDASIVVFSGDLSELGRGDLFTNATGMAYGSTHALDPEGFLYFFGSRGGVWVMAPAAEGRATPPVELTEQTIAKELASLDLGTYRPHLVYDPDDHALHVYVVRRNVSAEAAIVRHWLYEKRSKAWWPVDIENASLQPTYAWLSDGDQPDDRCHVIGCEDGRLRFWTPDTPWDDGTRIESSVLLGPILGQESGLEAILTCLEVTLAEGSVRYEVYASDNPADLGEPLVRGRTGRGFSGALRHRVRGGTLWVRLFNAAEGGAWRLESLFTELEAGGRRRVRS